MDWFWLKLLISKPFYKLLATTLFLASIDLNYRFGQEKVQSVLGCWKTRQN